MKSLFCFRFHWYGFLRIRELILPVTAWNKKFGNTAPRDANQTDLTPTSHTFSPVSAVAEASPALQRVLHFGVSGCSYIRFSGPFHSLIENMMHHFVRIRMNNRRKRRGIMATKSCDLSLHPLNPTVSRPIIHEYRV